MKCKIIFTINGTKKSFDLETDQNSPLIDLDIINILKNNDEYRESLCNLIREKYYNLSKKNDLTVNSLINKEGLLGNCGIEYLKEEFDDVSFPEGVDANILLINDLRIGSKSTIFGRKINSQGQELFIVSGKRDKDGDPNDIKKLAEFLRFRLMIESKPEYFSEDSEYYKDLNKIFIKRNLQENKVEDLKDLLLDFTYNRNLYYDIYISTEKGTRESAYNILQRICNHIREYGQRAEYSDPFINDINLKIIYSNGNTVVLPIDLLYYTIKEHYPRIINEFELNSPTEFHEFFSKTDYDLTKVFDRVVEGVGYETLFNELFKAEPEFRLKFSNYSNKSVIFKSERKTISEKYGIDYETIKTFDLIDNDYKGWKVYSFYEDDTTKYIASRNYLVEEVKTVKFNTFDEVISYINNSNETFSIKNNSFIDFKFRNKSGEIYDSELESLTIESDQDLIENSMIESIDIPLVKNTKIKEETLLNDYNQTYNDFKLIIDTWNISNELKLKIETSINNPEKIATFIYKVNELLNEDRSNESVINEIVDDIDKAAKRTYYIESKEKKFGKYKYRLIPADPIVIENYKENRKIPVMSLMLAINQVLSEKFNVNVNLMTLNEIKELFPEINSAKAFIRNGEIYVNTTIANSSDLLHEYVHLVLGVLKTNPELRKNYEQLMYIIVNTSEGKNTMRNLRRIYTDVSEIDLMEEIFAKLFSEYILSEANGELDEIFKGNEKFLKDSTKIIFNNEINDLKSFYGKSIKSVFSRFNSDISALLKLKDLSFANTRTYRIYLNWISKLINNGKLKEQCYG